MALFDQNSPGILGRASQWMTPDRAAAFQAVGMGLSQLGAGQPANLSPAYQALQERQQRTQQQRMLEESGVLNAFTPEQRAILAQMEPTAAQQVIAQVLFRPPEREQSPASVQEYRFAVENGFQGSFQEWLAGRGGESGETFGLTPMWGQDAEGNPVPLQLGNRGSLRPVELPEGVRPSMGGTQRVDLGTEWGILDRDGNMVQRIPKTLVGAPGSGEVITGDMDDPSSLTTQAIPGGAVDREQRQRDQETATITQQAYANAEAAVDLARQIRDDPALPSITGTIQGNLPPGIPLLSGGQAGADLNAKVLQLQGTAFLQAFETLKGGGPITDIEGQQATNAIARLQRAQSPEAYQAALDDFIDAVERGLAKLQVAQNAGEEDQLSAEDLEFLGLE